MNACGGSPESGVARAQAADSAGSAFHGTRVEARTLDNRTKLLSPRSLEAVEEEKKDSVR